MSSRTENHINEAERLLKLIDQGIINKQEDYLFVESIRARIKVGGFVTEKQIFWLRDVKDRQLEARED